jgi:hypothetical protein
MSVARPASVTRLHGPGARVDLRRAPLADVLAIDLRGLDRDFWTDESAIRDRLQAAWAGLDDAAWRLPGAAPSDAGGPDWSLLEHVAHIVDWQELAIDYVDEALATGRWPTDDDYDGGDFDTFNERRRDAYRSLSPSDVRRRLEAARPPLLEVAHRLPLATIRSDAAWGWVYSVLHGHGIDHLRVIEPWTEHLRARQAENDPFGAHPQPVAADPRTGIDRFWEDAASVFALFDELVEATPAAAWTDREVTPGWTIADHVGHLVAWFDEAVEALEEHRRSGRWIELPAEGIEAWNADRVRRMRGTPRDELLDRYEAGRRRLETAVRAMSVEDWLDPEGFSWAYEDLHGHLRAHLAMIAPYAVRASWPDG